MYRFPENLFADVRVERTDTTVIRIDDGKLMQNKVKSEQGAMIRVFDGARWYYSAITDLDKIQSELDALAQIAAPNPEILSHPVVKALEVNKGRELRYQDCNVCSVPNADKLALLESHAEVFAGFENVKGVDMIYSDKHLEKQIVSSLGTDVAYDQQFASVNFSYTVISGEMPHRGNSRFYETEFDRLRGTKEGLRQEILTDIAYAENAVPVQPGDYTCVFSPVTAGVFAHESFGHKSEADFMIGDETMKREWKIGSRVGSDLLNIYDTGCEEGSGYVPFDDEGCRAKKTYLIKDGILSGRLHSASTAADLGETATGNARAISFEYEPIVRMTNTCIGAGSITKEELFAPITDGIYIDTFKHGSGMSTFTIAPNRAYRIENGVITQPLRISVVSGNVMETLHNISGVSNEVKSRSSALGGCGKMEQSPLPVAFGGPFVRVEHIQVQ